MCVFFFKQKTAYEMRISDWSSDVCSADLALRIIMRRILEGRASPIMPHQPEHDRRPALRHRDIGNRAIVAARDPDELILAQHLAAPRPAKIGRASCRDRVCQYC